MNAPVYLDYNATAPLKPAVIEVIAAALAETGNPSSVHRFGRLAPDGGVGVGQLRFQIRKGRCHGNRRDKHGHEEHAINYAALTSFSPVGQGRAIVPIGSQLPRP